jgi:hypothetical protein
MKFFTRANNQPTAEQETATLSVPEGNTIITFFHESDRDFWSDLGPHVNILMLRLSGLFEWKFYYYHSQLRNAENKHEAVVSDLEKTFLFLPCTSVNFLNAFWQDLKNDTRMAPLLREVHVQPIPFRAAHGVAQSLLEKPLAAYPPGHARDEACVQIVAALEQKIRACKGIDKQPPVALLSETTSRMIVPARVG